MRQTVGVTNPIDAIQANARKPMHFVNHERHPCACREVSSPFRVNVVEAIGLEDTQRLYKVS